MLSIKQLNKTYANGVKAINDVSLDIPNGMFGLLGPNGAGKSSLMRTIATLQDPDSGSIHFHGLDVLQDKEGLRRQLGYLPQDFGVYQKVSAERLLNHFAVLKGLTGKGERKEAVDALLQQTNLWDARKRALGTYSGGMRQRFGIAPDALGRCAACRPLPGPRLPVGTGGAGAAEPAPDRRSIDAAGRDHALDHAGVCGRAGLPGPVYRGR
ncbi:hypothetical protein MasN3_09930 [Massilia varians]|uniref:ABC transporter domain-containing protein n=1 Tax=Massilia varians TaxID=457921 RepID=A0ABM8C2U2_9BURK|nr:hypothetical protein MasN3_09930 [Massilia varians]